MAVLSVRPSLRLYMGPFSRKILQIYFSCGDQWCPEHLVHTSSCLELETYVGRQIPLKVNFVKYNFTGNLFISLTKVTFYTYTMFPTDIPAVHQIPVCQAKLEKQCTVLISKNTYFNAQGHTLQHWYTSLVCFHWRGEKMRKFTINSQKPHYDQKSVLRRFHGVQ